MTACYIMKNRQLPAMAHGLHKHEYILFAEDGREVERLCVTAPTAQWVAAGSGLEFISPARAYALGAFAGGAA